ncbi:MAG: metalloregulator ArsR/SmtB family transcription factor [Magnetococcales bacterium]|nr:metalloregulator ArsR/SmtB family transcription factor [Magnetococcales bacterium]
MLTPETLMKSLVDETRLRCVMLLVTTGELCVCEFGYALGQAQPKISRHLGTLREHQVVQDRRAGQWVHYRLHSGLPPWAIQMIQAIAQGLEASEIHAGDRERLLNMPGRPGRCPETVPATTTLQEQESRHEQSM